MSASDMIDVNCNLYYLLLPAIGQLHEGELVVNQLSLFSVSLPLAFDVVTSQLHCRFMSAEKFTVRPFLPAAPPAVCFCHTAYYAYVPLRQSWYGTVHGSLWNYMSVVR
jgi:hypothetical protein